MRDDDIQISANQSGCSNRSKGEKIAELLVIVGATNARKINGMIHHSEVVKKRIKIISITVPIIFIVVASIVYYVVSRENLYSKGILLQSEGKWQEAISIFERIENYSDSHSQIDTTYYLQGKEYFAKGEWDSAIASFNLAGDYSDSGYQIELIYYQMGIEALEEKKWIQAIEYFQETNNYSDSSLKICESYYLLGADSLSKGKWDNAVNYFSFAGTYGDAQNMINRVRYEEGKYLIESQEWDKAENAFLLAGDYLDSKNQIMNTRYLHAKQLISLGQYFEAYDIFSNISTYADVQTILTTDSHFTRIATVKNTVVEGYIFQYGTYNGKTIIWKVLSVGDSSAYCIATDKVTSLAFNSQVVYAAEIAQPNRRS